MDEMSKTMGEELAAMASFQAEHIEKFAAAFIKETGLDPTKVKMVQQSLDNGFGYKVWFEPFPEESEIELYRMRAENAEARAEKAEARLAGYEVGFDPKVQMPEFIDGYGWVLARMWEGQNPSMYHYSKFSDTWRDVHYNSYPTSKIYCWFPLPGSKEEKQQ